MLNFSMFCKTYSGDLKRFELMLSSFNQHNVDGIRMYVSVPCNELSVFEKFRSNNVVVISDESYAKDYFFNNKHIYKGELSLGYCNQEICKLSFWESRLVKNYLCIDSDLIFVRDFYESDFMADKNTPYTVLVMDKELSIEKKYHNYWLLRQEYIKKIYSEVELEDSRYRTCHGMQVLNIYVLSDFSKNFMKKKGYCYRDLIEIAPFEFTWYNAWFQKCGLIKEVAVEPFFKTFHMRIEYIFSRLQCLTIEDYAYAYVGIILNSNWENRSTIYSSPSFWNRILYFIFNKL